MKKATPKNYYILIILIIPAKKGKKIKQIPGIKLKFC